MELKMDPSLEKLMPVKPLCTLGIILSLVAIPISLAGEAALRVRGTIDRLDGDTYIIMSRDGSKLRVKLEGKQQVWVVAKASIADVKPGSYVGVTGLPQADGSQRALEVHIMLGSTRPLGDRQRSWDLQPLSTLTNGNVEQTVASGGSQVLTIKYQQGEQKVIVPSGVPIVTLAVGERSELKPGAGVFIAAARKEPDGVLSAGRIVVGRGIEPPM
jgi:hypothetical protein